MVALQSRVRSAFAFILFALVAGCAAPLDEQSRATFANAYACPLDQVSAIRVARERPFTRYDVRGCGLRQTFACSIDVGCAPPAQAREQRGPSATSFPPSLVDQAPPPPPPLPDTQDGG